MTIEAALYARLSGFTALTNLVGTRIYPVQADQLAVRPYVVFWSVPGLGPCHVMGGAAPTLDQDLFQFDAYGDTALATMQVSAQIVAALRGFTGVMGGAGGVTVTACLDNSPHDLYEGDSKTHHRVTEFSIFHDAV